MKQKKILLIPYWIFRKAFLTIFKINTNNTQMKKLNLIAEFDKYYKGSDLQNIINNSPLPIKYTVDGFDCFFYNADLFGLFEMKVTKDGITPNDFINDYKNGFIKGLEYLKKEAKIKISSFDDSNKKDNLIKRLKIVLHEKEFKFGSKGLINLVFSKIPLIFTEKNIYDFGYWNGIIHSIENLCDITGLSEKDLKLTASIGNENIFQFENNFDKVEPNKIYNYFERNLVENGYLSSDNLETYILLAFQGNLKQPLEKFSFNNLHIDKVRTIFYKYFVEIANKPHGKKTNYAQLLGDYFNGFTTKKVENNFANGYIKVRK